MKIRSVTLGSVATNCYFLIQEATGETLVIDPADRADVIGRKALDEGLCLKAVLLTHGHGDHILAVNDLKKTFGIPVYAAADEESLLRDPDRNLSASLFGCPVTVGPDVLLQDGETFEAAGISLRMLLTPGHTPGSCCYYSEEEKILFSGDTLFCASVGRTDFPGGSSRELLRSIREKLLVLPEDVTVYPGHGESTSIGYEKKYNPYMCM